MSGKGKGKHMTFWDSLAKQHRIDEIWLEDETEKYWRDFAGDTQSDRKRWKRYLQETAVSSSGQEISLFECEMAYAENEGRLPKPKDDKAITLVILVGESFEPLLQSVWAHNPVRLVPVVNIEYPDGSKGDVQWNTIRVPLEMLLKRPSRYNEWQLKIPTVQFDAPDKAHYFKPVVDEPTEVFEFLQKHLKDDLMDQSRRVIVDITGAKKTMVAGAFMLAAYSDTEIYYVDSKRHNTDKFIGRPYGYACHFRDVDNPLKDLALQSWNNIEKLYNKGDYAHALAILQTIIPKADEKEPEEESHEKEHNLYLQNIQQLETYLQICAHWDEGDIQEAAELIPELIKKSKKLRKCVPFAVRTLAGEFPKTDDPTLNLKLFSKPKKIVIYVRDEIERVKRLIRKDASRAAFSRAYALYEALFNFRVTMLFQERALYVTPKKKSGKGAAFSNDPNKRWHKEAHLACTNMFSSRARNVLYGNDGNKYIFWKGESGANCGSTLEWVEPKRNNLEYLTEDFEPGELSDKRNLITHSYFPTDKDDARKALQLALNNFDDYLKNWVDFPKKLHISRLEKPELYSARSWETIREAFGLQFIPVQKE